MKTILFCSLWAIGAVRLAAAGYFVAPDGNDRHSGMKARPFRTIQKAADTVRPGDTVTVAPGVYFEHVRLRTQGTAERPIIFRSADSRLNRTVITGADRAIREGRVRWTADPAAPGLYRIPYPGPRPARVLYSGTDLYCYRSLAALTAFQATEKSPGPRHGFWWDEIGKTLYVRLHPDGQYGPADPNRQLMAVSPATGGGVNGTDIKPDQVAAYNFGLLAGPGQSVHTVIDGFTFETPGVGGVYIDGNDAVVRNCWFRGCRLGVVGRPRKSFGPVDGYARYTNRVTVENCDYTQFPAFQDALEDHRLRGGTEPRHWQRKNSSNGCTERNHYETGLAGLIGADWTIRRCRLWECFEGLAASGPRHSCNLRVTENRFERMIDNAVEFEDHARQLYFYRNVVVDVFMPFSWQPLKGMPWPGPIYVYRNLVYTTALTRGMWRTADGRIFAAPLKIGASLKQWTKSSYAKKLAGVSRDEVTVPAPGLLIFNNTFILPEQKLFEVIGGYSMKVNNVLIFNNIFRVASAPDVYRGKVPTGGPFSYRYENNLWYAPDASATTIALLGAPVAEPSGLGLENIAAGDFKPRPGGPAVGHSRPVPGAPVGFRDIGALQSGDAPFPAVGPQPRQLQE